MGWVERRFVGRVDPGSVEDVRVVLSVAVKLDGKGGGGVRGRDGDDEGVAFSMRAQVR
jgi:hypothetical protein